MAATGGSGYRFDHIAVGVWSIADAVPFYEDELGGWFLLGFDLSATGNCIVPRSGEMQVVKALEI
jgi:hypothetical protein